MAYVARFISEHPVVSAYFFAETVVICSHIRIVLKALRGLEPRERPAHIRMLLSRNS